MSVKLTDQMTQYITLLRIRQKGRRRDVRISGGVFLISILVTVALGLVGRLDGRENYLLMGLLIALGVSFFMSWVRLEILMSTLELADYVQRGGGEQ